MRVYIAYMVRVYIYIYIYVCVCVNMYIYIYVMIYRYYRAFIYKNKYLMLIFMIFMIFMGVTTIPWELRCFPFGSWNQL